MVDVRSLRTYIQLMIPKKGLHCILLRPPGFGWWTAHLSLLSFVKWSCFFAFDMWLLYADDDDGFSEVYLYLA